MNKRVMAQVLACVVLVWAVVVMFGWFLNIPILESIFPTAVAMKFITALSFFFSAILIIIMAQEEKGDISSLFILIISFALFLLMTSFFVSLFLGFSTGMENLFVKEAPGAVKTAVLGVPAIATMICFMLIALAGLFCVYNPKKLIGSFWFGIITLVIGGIATIGYLVNVSFLYYEFPGYTPISFPAAVLFILLSISLILLKEMGAEK